MKGHLHDVIYALGRKRAQAFNHLVGGDPIGADDLVGPSLLHDQLVALRSYRRDHMCSSLSGQPHRPQSDSSRSTLYQDRASVDGPRYVDSAMGGDAGNAEARALFKRNLR